MLDIYFFNVGDGDSSLLSLKRQNLPDFNILIDSGRNSLLELVPESKRQFSSLQMIEMGIDHIDVLMITHLHTDHMGHIIEIAKNIPIFKAIVPYIPSCRIINIPPASENDPYKHKFDEFAHVIQYYTEAIDYLKNHGCNVKTAWDEPEFKVDDLTVKTILTENKLKDQIELYEMLCKNSTNPEFFNKPFDFNWHDITENRNPESLMEIINYDGKQFLFAGDRYGKTFEDWSYGNCDLIKIPHHGDPKSLTKPLIEKLNPKYGIISCQMNVRKDKDRPNEDIIKMLQAHKVDIYCTENREMSTLSSSSCKRIHARIENGEISIEKID